MNFISIVIVAKYFVILPILAILVLFFRLKAPRRKELIFLVIVGGGLSWLLAKGAGYLIHSPRPFIVNDFTPLIYCSRDNGFPSDHTLLASFLGYVGLRYSRALGLALLLVAVLIGFARVLAGAHHAVDIIGSFLIAGIGFLIALKLTLRYINHKL